MIYSFEELCRKEVIDIRNGERLGYIDDLRLDADSAEVTALLIYGRRWFFGREEGIEIPCKHVANSPAILLRPETQLDAVRAGDVLFGLCPVDEDKWKDMEFEQVMSWYTYVVMVKEVPKGTEVGYGGTFVCPRDTKIATIPVGFADGYSRRLSNLGKVRINGYDAPIIGRVCMDQFMVDVTDIPEVKRGDTVSLIDNELSVLWMADLLGCNVDEIVCSVSKRVPRIYEY
jgi:alanine racemase